MTPLPEFAKRIGIPRLAVGLVLYDRSRYGMEYADQYELLERFHNRARNTPVWLVKITDRHNMYNHEEIDESYLLKIARRKINSTTKEIK